VTKDFRKRVRHVLKGGYLTKQGRIGEDMTKGEENIVLNERDELIQTIEAQQQMIFEANKQIQAQQQEIDRLKELLADWKYNTKCDADHIAALTADKDEQAGRIMEQDTLLKESRDLFNAVRGILKDVGRLFQASQKQVAATATMAFIIIIDALNKKIDALLGGKEDES
jgi:hypothetical protein